MIAALFADCKSPEKSSALSAVKLQRECNLYYTGKQFHTTRRILTLTSKLKLRSIKIFNCSQNFTFAWFARKVKTSARLLVLPKFLQLLALLAFLSVLLEIL